MRLTKSGADRLNSSKQRLMKMPCVYSMVPMAPSATRMRRVNCSRNSRARLLLTVVMGTYRQSGRYPLIVTQAEAREITMNDRDRNDESVRGRPAPRPPHENLPVTARDHAAASGKPREFPCAQKDLRLLPQQPSRRRDRCRHGQDIARR